MKKAQRNVTFLPLDSITPDKNQPRKVFDIIKMKILKESIQKHGVINPLSVQKLGDKYLLVDGERRYRCAVELKLEEVPVVVLEPMSETERLIQQFHIQEHHAEWSPTEKALAMKKIQLDMNIPFAQLGELLGINKSVLDSYAVFISLVKRDLYSKEELPLLWAKHIKGFTVFIKKLAKENETKLSDNLIGDIEEALIRKIKSGAIKKTPDIAKLKDAVSENYKILDKLINGTLDVEKNIRGTQSTSAFHIRNALVNLNYAIGHVNQYLSFSKRKTIDAEEKSNIKNAIKVLSKLI